jgi:uncharacterized LabA/DUF88 family protein
MFCTSNSFSFALFLQVKSAKKAKKQTNKAKQPTDNITIIITTPKLACKNKLLSKKQICNRTSFLYALYFQFFLYTAQKCKKFKEKKKAIPLRFKIVKQQLLLFYSPVQL